MGGERGFEAALSFLDFARAESAAEGESMKTKMKMQRAAPTTMVIGFERRSERTGPIVAAGMGEFGLWGFGIFSSHMSPRSEQAGSKLFRRRKLVKIRAG